MMLSRERVVGRDDGGSPAHPRFLSTRGARGLKQQERAIVRRRTASRAPRGARGLKHVVVWLLPWPARAAATQPHVSIHAPRVGRDLLCAGERLRALVVSIHAPRVSRGIEGAPEIRRHHGPRPAPVTTSFINNP